MTFEDWYEDNVKYMNLADFKLWLHEAFDAGATHEREACAKVCEEGWKEGIGAKYQGDVFAEAIKARNEK
jgi:hypothetical protein